jgi:hypothetical protein
MDLHGRIIGGRAEEAGGVGSAPRRSAMDSGGIETTNLICYLSRGFRNYISLGKNVFKNFLGKECSGYPLLGS